MNPRETDAAGPQERWRHIAHVLAPCFFTRPGLTGVLTDIASPDETPIVYAKDDPREEISPGIYRIPLELETYRVSMPVIFPDSWEGVRRGEEHFDARCDHCGGFWDGLFPSQESADQWFVQHRAVCLGVPPPPLVGE